MLKTVFKLTFVGLCVSSAVAESDFFNDDFVKTAGDVLQIALPLTALTATYTLDDPDGRTALMKSYGASFLTTHLTAQLIKQANSGGNSKFPNAHSSSAFSGASFLAKRYGWDIGVPAYLAASFTGYSQIHTDNADVWDVLAGAGLAIAFNEWLVVKPETLNVALYPNKDSVKLALNYQF